MILNLLKNTRVRPSAADKAAIDHNVFFLTRHFVLTGDERCPIAGTWLRLDTSELPAPADDSSLARPAMGVLPWRAIHRLFTQLHYLPA
jgi:hypothetical protein